MLLDVKSFCDKWLFYHILTFLKLKPEYAEGTRPIPWLLRLRHDGNPDSKVHETNMGPIWGRQDPDEPHVGPMNCAIWVNGYFSAAWNTDWLLLTVWMTKLICRKQLTNNYLHISKISLFNEPTYNAGQDSTYYFAVKIYWTLSLID